MLMNLFGDNREFDKVDTLKRKLDSMRPLDSEALSKLREVLKVEDVYNSNAIEGNTLTLLETKLVVEEGLTISGKSVKEHLEAINLEEAISYLNTLVTGETELNEKVIKDLHFLVLKGIEGKERSAGVYRKQQVLISGSGHVPVSAMLLEEKMKELLAWYESVKGSIHPIQLAALFHHKLVYIHPFIDGNGRTARLCMQFILMRHGYPAPIIKGTVESRLRYYQSLEEANGGNVAPFVRLVTDAVEEMLEKYLAIFES